MTTTPTGRGATLHDVAVAAGVSLATASRVLNGSERRVAPSYRTRVEAAAARLGYTANLSAQATARGTATTVALLVADIADPYFGRLAAGVARGADATGLVVTIAVTERDPHRELTLVRALRGQRPRGLILAASRSDDDLPQLADELDAFARSGGNVAMLGPGPDGARTVEIDNRGASAALGGRLASLGYRVAVVVGAEPGVRTSDDRIDGFRAGFQAGGGAASTVLRAGFTRDDGYEAGRAAFERGVPRGTLFFGVSDVVAIGLVSAARDAGRDIGTDIAVAGFDDIATGRDIRPALTTVRVPLEELGHRALRAATEREWTPGTEPPLELEIVVRQSTPPRP